MILFKSLNSIHSRISQQQWVHHVFFILCTGAYMASKPQCLRSNQAPLSLLLHRVSSHDQNNEKAHLDSVASIACTDDSQGQSIIGWTELEAVVINGFRRAVQRAGGNSMPRGPHPQQLILSMLHNPSPSEFRCTTFEALAANSFLLAMLVLPRLQAQCNEGTRQLHRWKDKGASLQKKRIMKVN